MTESEKIEALLEENENLKAACRKLRESNKFYANSDNWLDNDILGCQPSIRDDYREPSKHLSVGGRRAYEAEDSPEVKAVEEILR